MIPHLRYDLWDANVAGEMRHAQVVMRELGIDYEKAVPQSMADSWHFYNCTNVPEVLPSFIAIWEK